MFSPSQTPLITPCYPLPGFPTLISENKPNMKQQSSITRREQEVLELMAMGNINKEIGDRLNISTDTVKQHVKNIYYKLGARNKIEALNKLGLLTIPVATN